MVDLTKKGKTYEELYGVEKALVIKLKSRLSHLGKPSRKKGIKVSPEVVEKSRVARLGRKMSEEEKQKRRGTKRSEETKQKISQTTKNMIRANPELRKRPSYEEYYGVEKALEIKKKQALKCDRELRSQRKKKYWQLNPNGGFKGRKHTEELKQASRERRKNVVFPKKDSSIEVKVQQYLKDLGIDFFTHQYMNIEHGYQCDILIPSINLVIECDGDYWHKYPVGTEVDVVRTKELMEKGFKVLRIWEREIRQMSKEDLKQKIEVTLR